MNVDYKFNQGFKTLFCYFHQALMGIKMFFTSTCIANMLTKFCSWSHRILKCHQGHKNSIWSTNVFWLHSRCTICGICVVAPLFVDVALSIATLVTTSRIITLWSGGLSCYKLFSCVNSRCHKINLCCTSVLDIQQYVSWF
jgi:hypothetical protein